MNESEQVPQEFRSRSFADEVRAYHDSRRVVVGGARSTKTEPTVRQALAAMQTNVGEQPLIGGAAYFVADGGGGARGIYPAETDYATTSKLGGLLRKGERLNQFFARSGLGPAQIRSLTRKQLEEHIKTVAQNDLNDGVFQPRAFAAAMPVLEQRGGNAAMVGWD